MAERGSVGRGRFVLLLREHKGFLPRLLPLRSSSTWPTSGQKKGDNEDEEEHGALLLKFCSGLAPMTFERQ